MKAVQLFVKILLPVAATGGLLRVIALPGNIQLALEPVTLPELQGLQSFACRQYNGNWLLICGRVDGLHRRQPWASLDLEGRLSYLLGQKL